MQLHLLLELVQPLRRRNNMNMKKHKILFAFIIFFGLYQCQPKTDKNLESSDTWKVDRFKLKRGNDLNSKDWNCNMVEGDQICVPSSWRPMKNPNTYYFCDLNNNNINTYFGILRLNLKGQNMRLKDYLKRAYSILLNDKRQENEGYSVKKLFYTDREVYYSEYYTKIDGKRYITYSMLLNKNDFLYDIALKVERSRSKKYYEAFQDILYNYKIGGKLVFDENDRLEKIQLIDLSKL